MNEKARIQQQSQENPLRSAVQRNQNLKPWKCTSCGYWLGVVEEDSLRMKRKDCYIETRGGEVTTLCTACGKTNTLTDDRFQAIKSAEGRG